MNHKKMKAVVLAAGKGTRLQTEGCDLPKVMRIAAGQPLLHYVLDAISFIPPKDTILVVGYGQERVRAHFVGYPFAEQTEQLGTGHAVMAAKEYLTTGCPILVCCGDMPLLRRDTYAALADTHLQQGNVCTMLTGETHLNLPFGRIVRNESDKFQQIIEERDCTPGQRAIPERNAGVYIFDSRALLDGLRQLKCDNSQGEYYLTDVPAILQAKGAKIGICKRNLGNEIIGVNTIEELKQVEQLLQETI